jgi:tRNA A37 threonylcarbamoyltransferase TsaD
MWEGGGINCCIEKVNGILMQKCAFFSVQFPYLVLLISGGHSLLAVVKGVDDFCVVGKGIDDAPGEALDKVLVIQITVL